MEGKAISLVAVLDSRRRLDFVVDYEVTAEDWVDKALSRSWVSVRYVVTVTFE